MGKSLDIDYKIIDKIDYEKLNQNLLYINIFNLDIIDIEKITEIYQKILKVIEPEVLEEYRYFEEETYLEILQNNFEELQDKFDFSIVDCPYFDIYDLSYYISFKDWIEYNDENNEIYFNRIVIPIEDNLKYILIQGMY